MKFINDLYNMYRNHLTGDDEDAVALVLGVLQDQERPDLIKLVKEMDDDELYSMLSYYLIEKMRDKMAEEGIGHVTLKTDPLGNRVH